MAKDNATLGLALYSDPEPSEHVTSRLITRLQRGDPRGPAAVETGEFDRRLDRLTGDDPDL